MIHLAQKLLPGCRTPGDDCCSALPAPDAVACSPRWAATLQIHLERARVAMGDHPCASTGPRVCPFASATFVANSPCDAPVCARLWSAGEMDAACTVTIADFCSRGQTSPPACTWYAAAHTPCRAHVSSGNSSWYSCAAVHGYPEETSVLDEASAVQKRALRRGHTTASLDAFRWMNSDTKVRDTFVSYFVNNTHIRFVASRGSTNPLLLYAPVVTAAGIAMPILVVGTLAYFAALDFVRRSRASTKKRA